MRVTQQQDCYAAEQVLGDGGLRFANITAAQRWVDDLRDTRWWHTFGYSFAVLRIEVAPYAGKHAGVSQYVKENNAGYIRLHRDYLNAAVALHEVAHVLAAAQLGSTCHDPAWARTYLTLVSCVLGPDAYLKLQASFDAHGVNYDAPVKFGSAFAL